jgi:hypothetical protein
MKRSIFFVGLLGAMILAGVLPAYAAPPFNTEDVGVNPVGKFQFSAVADMWKHKFQPGVELRHGITEAMDVGVGAGYAVAPKDEKGVGSFEITPKFMLIPDIFAVIASVSVGDPEYEGYLILGHAFGPIAINANLGCIAEAGAKHVDIPYLLSVSYQHEYFEIGPEIGFNVNKDGFKFNMWNLATRVFPFPWLAWVTAVGGDFSKGGYHGLNVQAGIDMVFPYEKEAEKEPAPEQTAAQPMITPTGSATSVHNQPVQASNATDVQSPVILNAPASASTTGSVPAVQNEPVQAPGTTAVQPPAEPNASAQ